MIFAILRAWRRSPTPGSMMVASRFYGAMASWEATVSGACKTSAGGRCLWPLIRTTGWFSPNFTGLKAANRWTNNSKLGHTSTARLPSTERISGIQNENRNRPNQSRHARRWMRLNFLSGLMPRVWRAIKQFAAMSVQLSQTMLPQVLSINTSPVKSDILSQIMKTKFQIILAMAVALGAFRVTSLLAQETNAAPVRVGVTNRYQTLAADLRRQQEAIHREVFSSAPPNEALAEIKDRIPEIEKQAG